jgi:predicted ATPase
MTRDAFLLSATLRRDKVPDPASYPFTIPALRAFSSLAFHPAVTFFVGENGSGKSTLLEAIAVAAGMNAEGGSQNFNFSTRTSHSELHLALRIARSARRPRSRYFLRAESFYNVSTQIERLDVLKGYGGTSLHEQSHGEAFLTLARERFGPEGLYLLDEPEAALSPQRQMSFLRRMHVLVEQGSQFIVATHSPILLAYPSANIHLFSAEGMALTAYEDTEHFRLTRDFLVNRQRYLGELLASEEEGEAGRDSDT